VAHQRVALRIREVVAPGVRVRVESLDRIVELPLEPGDACKRAFSHRPRRERRDRHVPLDVGQDLPASLVDPKRSRHVIEPNVAQVGQQREDRLGVRAGGTAHGVPDADDRAQVGDPAPELLLRLLDAFAHRYPAPSASARSS